MLLYDALDTEMESNTSTFRVIEIETFIILGTLQYLGSLNLKLIISDIYRKETRGWRIRETQAVSREGFTLMRCSLSEGERENWGTSAGSANRRSFWSIGACWPMTPQSVKRSAGQWLRRRCIKKTHGLRDQPLFCARSQSCDSVAWKFLLKCTPRGEQPSCGGKGAGLQLGVFHSLDLILWPGAGNSPLCTPLPEMRASLGAGLFLTDADSDIWVLSWAMPRAIPDVAAASCAQSTQPGWCFSLSASEALQGLLRWAENFLWESLCQSSALDCNNLSLWASPAICLYSSLHN